MPTAGDIVKAWRKSSNPTYSSLRTAATTAAKQDASSSGSSKSSGGGGNSSGSKSMASKSNTSTSTTTQNVSVRVPSAWEQTTQERNAQSTFQNWYDKVDYGLFGWLPGGLSRDRVAAMDMETKAEELNTRARAQSDFNESKIQEDYSKKSWWENFGIGYPDEEKEYQERQGEINTANVLERQQDVIRETNIFREIGSNIGGGFTEGIKEKSTDWGNYALIGAAAVIAVMVLKK